MTKENFAISSACPDSQGKGGKQEKFIKFKLSVGWNQMSSSGRKCFLTLNSRRNVSYRFLNNGHIKIV